MRKFKRHLVRKRYYVYIIECSDSSYYTGVTNNIKKRFREHCRGSVLWSYTATRRPLILRYYMEYGNIVEAIRREKQIKGWTRKKKEALFTHDWETLKKLSANSVVKNQQMLSASTSLPYPAGKLSVTSDSDYSNPFR
jgi:putative endonuclease